MKVAIALAAYNPHFDFLRQQIESLQAQTFSNWICVISDESSDPKLSDLLRQLVARDSRFVLLSADGRRRGVFYNFERALKHIFVNYFQQIELIALCDQDDVWHKDKLAVMAQYFAEHPKALLVHSDLKLIDSNNQLQAQSCWAHEARMILSEEPLSHLVLRNSVTGCACMFRPGLLSVALPFPENIQDEYLHDHWLAVLARAYGPLGVLKAQLTNYRQHQFNVVGAQGLSAHSIWAKFRKLGELRRKSAKALRVREKLASDLMARLLQCDLSGAALDEEAIQEILPIVERSKFFYLRYFIGSIGKPFEFALSFQLLVAVLF